jgi:hypothetical protein
VTTMPLPLVEEVTPPLDGWRLLDDELVELEAADDEPEASVGVDALPGMVAALMAANTPTAPRATAPTQKVNRFSSRRPASRASMRVISMVGSLCNVAELQMGTGWEFAET